MLDGMRKTSKRKNNVHLVGIPAAVHNLEAAAAHSLEAAAARSPEARPGRSIRGSPYFLDICRERRRSQVSRCVFFFSFFFKKYFSSASLAGVVVR